jgi:hypothetical protein
MDNKPPFVIIVTNYELFRFVGKPNEGGKLRIVDSLEKAQKFITTYGAIRRARQRDLNTEIWRPIVAGYHNVACLRDGLSTLRVIWTAFDFQEYGLAFDDEGGVGLMLKSELQKLFPGSMAWV